MGETDAVDLIIREGTLLTMDPEGRLVEGGSVAVGERVIYGTSKYSSHIST